MLEFGIIFDIELLDESEIIFNVSSIFFAKDGVITTGKYKESKIENLKMFRIDRNEEDYRLISRHAKNTLAFLTFNSRYTKNGKLTEKSIEYLKEICFSFADRPIKGSLYEGMLFLSNTSRISKNEIENVKENFDYLIRDALSEMEKEDIIVQDTPLLPSKKELDVLELLSKLKSKIKGQDKTIETVLPNILVNMKALESDDEDFLNTVKSTILIDGSTGVGKTLLVSEIAKLLDVPIIIKNATSYSSVGYVGDDLNSLLVELLRSANGDLEKANNGIICLDEIDKLGDSKLEMRKGLQQELLSYVSGSKITVKYMRKEYTFDTNRITFIFMGAFTNMREEKVSVKSIGFESKTHQNENIFTTNDYVKFGMLRELIGRINLICHMDKLTIKDFKDILLNSSISPLKKLITLCSLYDAELDYTEEFIDATCEKALKDDTGARALTKIMNDIRAKILLKVMTGEVTSITLTSDFLDDDFELTNQNKRTLIEN